MKCSALNTLVGNANFPKHEELVKRSQLIEEQQMHPLPSSYKTDVAIALVTMYNR
jgi:hypothetical protein